MPAWSALKESNLPLRVKSPVHDRYAKDGWCCVTRIMPYQVDAAMWPAREDSTSRPAGSKPAALLQLSYGQVLEFTATIKMRIDRLILFVATDWRRSLDSNQGRTCAPLV